MEPALLWYPGPCRAGPPPRLVAPKAFQAFKRETSVCSVDSMSLANASCADAERALDDCMRPRAFHCDDDDDEAAAPNLVAVEHRVPAPGARYEYDVRCGRSLACAQQPREGERGPSKASAGLEGMPQTSHSPRWHRRVGLRRAVG